VHQQHGVIQEHACLLGFIAEMQAAHFLLQLHHFDRAIFIGRGVNQLATVFSAHRTPD